MKVAIDVSPLGNENQFRGVGVYTRNLTEALSKLKTKDLELELVKTKRKDLKNFDLVHYPYFDFFFATLPFFKKTKTVVTVHDTIPLIFPRFYPPGMKGFFKLKLQNLSLLNSSAVITDSISSKKDIIKYLKYPEKKINVVYLSYNENIFKVLKDDKRISKVIKKYSLPERFVLYVGDINYNKNVLSLVKACKLNKIPLVIVGKKAVERNFDKTHIENRPLVKLLKRYGGDKDILRVGFVPDKDLVAFYNLAEVYCQPSYYEGFGISVLDAMACGCPVVCSNASSLPEVASNAAIMIDPENIEDMARGINLAINDSDLRQKLINKGFERIKFFSWEKTAKQTYEVYKKVVEK